MSTLVIAIIILVLLGLVVIATSFRRSDTSTAIGQLSGETVRRDRGSESLGTEAAVPVGDSLRVVDGRERASAWAARAGSRAARTGSWKAVFDYPTDFCGRRWGF